MKRELFDRIILKYFTYTKNDNIYIHKSLSNFEAKRGIYSKRNLDNVRLYLENRYSDYTSYKETLYRIMYDIEACPECKICGNPAQYLGKSYRVYSDTCSKECKLKLNSTKCANTKETRYNDKHYNNQEKAANTRETKYGCRSLSQIKEFKEKADTTREARYGNKCMLLTKQAEAGRRDENGLLWNQTEEGKIKQKEIANRPEVKEKIYKTKLKNGTQNTSEEERIIGSLLQTKYDVLFNYGDDSRYPYSVDYYIPKLDLFIEYHGHFTHGNHPYNETNYDDINKVKELWNKIYEDETKYKYENPSFESKYRGVIHTWCYRDVAKRNIAKQNNLNYIEIWGLEDAYNFLIMMKIDKELISSALYKYKYRIPQID